MAETRLGDLLLRWCDRCDLPVLKEHWCGRCDGRTVRVRITPPGDVRPAFAGDLELLRKVMQRQFGVDLLPTDRVILLNRCPAIDRCDEVIVDGKVWGNLTFLPPDRYVFRPRIYFARTFAQRLRRGWVQAAEDAIPFVLSGTSLLAIGVDSADASLRAKDEVVVVDSRHRAIGVGTALLDGPALVRTTKGKGVRVRAHLHVLEDRDRRPGGPTPKPSTWTDVVEANQRFLERSLRRGVDFVHATMASVRKPIAVSLSGGKDSLATLLVCLAAGTRPSVLFIDTGLEFPETVAHVHEIVARYDLKLLQRKAGDQFWDSLAYFGPPGKDYRWCCKAIKLGPIVSMIEEHFPTGVLTFIGQRRYESSARAAHGAVWRNPWVEKQVGASPIQDWTALHVWLYLMQQGVPVNPWYEKGMERIGCFMCPASSLADLDTVRRTYPGMERWDSALEAHAQRQGQPQAYTDYALWRWKTLPEGMTQLLSPGELAASLTARTRPMAVSGGVPLEFHSAGGYEPCIGGVSREGAFTKAIQMERASNFLVVLGPIERDEHGISVTQEGIEVFAEGAVISRGADTQRVDSQMTDAVDQIFRAIDCIGCGVCVGKCPTESVSMRDNLAWIDEETCVHCNKCMDKCPITSFSPAMKFKDWEFTPQE